jgi:hypothetical protein
MLKYITMKEIIVYITCLKFFLQVIFAIINNITWDILSSKV